MPCLPLGLGLVAAAARKAGHEVVLLDLFAEAATEAALEEAVDSFSPQVIGISVRNIDDQDFVNRRFLLEPVREVVAACRRHSPAPIVLGGAGYSIFPEAALRYLKADWGIRGEGEEVFPRLLAALERGKDPLSLPGVYAATGGSRTPRGFAADLDALPMPDVQCRTAENQVPEDVWLPVQTRRGCPIGCSYCSTPAIEGRAVRARTPHRVAEYLARMADAGLRRFYLVDNTFNLPEDYALALCRSIAALRQDVQWRAILYPQAVSDELVHAMAEAGCVEVSLGFESGAPAVLQAMGKRYDRREVQSISRRLAANGIRRMGFLLLGGPGETRHTVRESLAFAESLELEMLKITVGIRIYPHTPLAKLALEEGVVAPGDDLLQPTFYLRDELREWIGEVIPEEG